jgi:hypothetical protein
MADAADERFDWKDYLALAKKLAAEKDAASLRSAISRGYYYVFHIALDRAKDNNYEYVVQTGTHKSMWQVYLGSPVFDCQKLGTMGQRLQRERERADYDDYLPKLADTTAKVMAEVENFAKILATVDARHPKQSSQRFR